MCIKGGTVNYSYIVTDLPGFRRLLIGQGGVSSHRGISGNKNSYIAPIPARLEGSASWAAAAADENRIYRSEKFPPRTSGAGPTSW